MEEAPMQPHMQSVYEGFAQAQTWSEYWYWYQTLPDMWWWIVTLGGGGVIVAFLIFFFGALFDKDQ